MFKFPKIPAIFLLGFASGLPLALSGSTLSAWYTESGVNLVHIGLLSLVGIPYTIKWLWAPLMDCVGLPWLGYRRGWIALSQLLLSVVFFTMSWMTPQQTPGLLALLGLGVAFFSASQDIAFDAYRTELLSAKERGLGAAATVSGYRLAMLVSGGVTLLVAYHTSWHIAYGLMGTLMAILTGLTLLAPSIPQQAQHLPALWASFQEAISEFRARPHWLSFLIFIILYKLADAFALSLNMTFLLRELHFSLQEIGWTYKVVSLSALLVGSWIGGVWLTRMNLYQALWAFGLVQAGSLGGFLGLTWIGHQYGWMIFAVFLENFGSALGTVALLSLLMGLCESRYTATQFALFSSVSAIGRVFIGPIAGWVANTGGWRIYYGIGISLGIPALILLRWLKSRVNWKTEKIGVSK